MPIIDVKATGTNIKNIIKSKGFKISDVQADAVLILRRLYSSGCVGTLFPLLII